MANLERLLERLVSERLVVLGRVCNEQTGPACSAGAENETAERD
jgi:hypothetical protein